MSKSIKNLLVVVLSCSLLFSMAGHEIFAAGRCCSAYRTSNVRYATEGHYRNTYCNACGALVSSTLLSKACNKNTTKVVGYTTYYYCSLCGKAMGSKTSIPSTPSSGGSGSSSSGGSSTEIKDSTKNGSGNLSCSFNGLCANCCYEMEMWHYSGGYWQIGNYLQEKEKLSDSKLGALVLIQNHLNTNYKTYECTIAYPSGLNKDNCTAKVVSLNQSSVTIVSSRNESDGIHIKANFTYNLISGYSMDSYVSGMNKDVPLISTNYGYNVYSMYGNNLDASEGLGHFDTPTNISSPYIHPSEIKDKSGTLKSGYNVYVANASRSSSGFSIGKNTFSNAGAVGLRFIFPFTVTFSKIEEKTTTSESNNTSSGSGTNSGSGSSTGGSATQTGSGSGGTSSGDSNTGGSATQTGSGTGGTSSGGSNTPTKPTKVDPGKIHRLY